MDKSQVCKLVGRVFTTDEFGIQQPVETEIEVFCQIKSVTQTEFFEGGRNGLRPQFQVTMNRFEYNNEPIVEIGGVRYSVYRTYFTRDDSIELYLEEKKGND